MATAFLRTLHSLEADSFRRSIGGLLLVALLLGAWFAWFFLSRVARYEVTGTARLEVDRAIHLVQAPVAGRVITSRLVLDQEVQAGDPLVELDANPERLQMQEEQTRLKALDPQMESLHGEIAAAEQAQLREQQATRVALEEARARHQEAEALARLADGEAERLARLHASGLIPEREFVQGKSEAERRRAAAESLRLVMSRLENEQRTRDSDRESHRQRLQGEVIRLQGLRTTAAATIERLKYESERRRILAPVAGRLGEVAILRAGAFVEEGEKLGAIVPAGTLRIVAEFPPAAALGRIRPGQPARLRLHGFPWAQYGSIAAKVTGVASEVRDERVRVELGLVARPASVIPLQHGLPGTVEVEVEQLPPATLVLRAAGRLIAVPTTSFTPQPE